MNLAVQLAPENKKGLKLENPVMTASGTFGYGMEYEHLFDIQKLGAIVCKGTMLEPRDGNPQPRIAETPNGMLNSIGLQGIGVEALIKEKTPVWAGWKVPVIVNIAGGTIDEYAAVAAKLDKVPGVAGLEINIRTHKPMLGNDYGGLSGPAIKPVAVYMIYQVYKSVRIPIVGCGGVTNADDAIEFFMAGATAIEVGTASFANPRAPMDILEGIEAFCTKEKIQDLRELTGAAHR